MLQAYVGPALTAPPENTFTPKGQVTPDYVRGDVQLVVPPTGFSQETVAEGYLVDNGSAKSSAGAGNWSAEARFTLAAPGTVTLSFNYANLLEVENSAIPTGSFVSARYTFNFTITDGPGNTIFFIASPTAVNQTISLTTPGILNSPSSGIPATGTVSTTSGTLAAGTYFGTISGNSRVSLRISATVPEPSTLATAFVAIALTGLGVRRHRSRKSA